MKKSELQKKYETLVGVLQDIHWMSRRYADGRKTYAVSMHNDATRVAVSLGIELKRPLYARDGGGRIYDRLTDEEVAEIERLDPIYSQNNMPEGDKDGR